MNTGIVKAVNYATGQIQVAIDQTGFLAWYDMSGIGNNNSGIQFGPSVNDKVLLDEVQGLIIVTHAVPDQVSQKVLLEGQWIFFNKAGCTIYLDPTGIIRIIPGTGGEIQFGTTGLKAVVRDGDTVTGTDSHGDTITGVVHASSVTTYSQ